MAAYTKLASSAHIIFFSFTNEYKCLNADIRMAKLTVNQPQSQAGILGVNASTNMGGHKFEPKGFVIVSVMIILLVKILDKVIAG